MTRASLPYVSIYKNDYVRDAVVFQDLNKNLDPLAINSILHNVVEKEYNRNTLMLILRTLPDDLFREISGINSQSDKVSGLVSGKFFNILAYTSIGLESVPANVAADFLFLCVEKVESTPLPNSLPPINWGTVIRGSLTVVGVTSSLYFGVPFAVPIALKTIGAIIPQNKPLPTASITVSNQLPPAESSCDVAFDIFIYAMRKVYRFWTN